MLRDARKVLTFVFLLLFTFAAGCGVGIYFYPQLLSASHQSSENGGHNHGPSTPARTGAAVIELTKQATENLGLKLGTIQRGEYWKSQTVPGEIVEIPGKSDLAVSAPLAGVVEEVFVRAGQALAPSDPLFTIRIVDEELAAAQAKLLATLARQEVVRKEIERLKPITDSQIVSGQKRRDFEYELRQLESDKQTRIQELRVNGLPEPALQSVIESKDLASRLLISVPSFIDESHDAGSSASTKPRSDYSIENLNVYPGKSVSRGEDLCSLAFHAELYLEGQAFEGDLAALSRITEQNWPIIAEFGHNHQDGHGIDVVREDLRLLHVDNHVDPTNQTFKFYLPLGNEVKNAISDKAGRTFQQWLFKPGQRVHLKLPVERWENQLLLPIESVVVEGPNAFVFVEHIHTQDPIAEAGSWVEKPGESNHRHGADGHGHGEHSHAHDAARRIHIELEPVPVRLLHRDNRWAVIANDGQLEMDQRIALNNAYKLNLAMKMKASGGGGHGHGHEH